MKISAYVDSHIEAEGQPLQMAGCGIVLLAESGSETIKRCLGFGLSNSDRMRTLIQSLRLALCAINQPYRQCEVLLYNNDSESYKLLHQIGRKYSYEYNEPFVKELRLVADTFKDMYVVVGAESDAAAKEAAKIAHDCALSQKNYDLG